MAGWMPARNRGGFAAAERIASIGLIRLSSPSVARPCAWRQENIREDIVSNTLQQSGVNFNKL
jgi:hypothetical protein